MQPLEGRDTGMRFSLYAHMERLTPGQTHAALFADFIELAEIADAAGFEAVWTGERHGMDLTPSPNPFITMANLAPRLDNVRLGAAVAPIWGPVRLAEEAALADIVSGGRLDLGLARGAAAYEIARVGGETAGAAAEARHGELVGALRGLWRGDHVHQTANWSFPATSSAPKPMRRDGPAIWLEAETDAGLDAAAAQGCGASFAPLWRGDAEIEAWTQRLAGAAARAGGARVPSILVSHCFVGQSEAETIEIARVLSRFYATLSAWGRGGRAVSQGQIAPLTEDELVGADRFAPEVIRAAKPMGSADQVIERLRAYEAMGVERFALWMDSGMSQVRKRRALKLFIDQVMPAFA